MAQSKRSLIWIGALVVVVVGQWAFHNYNIWDKMFRSADSSLSERKIAYWVAPMDPNYVSDKPGKSPMGMDLVPVYEDEISPQTSSGISSDSKGGSPGQVMIDPVTVHNIGVRSVVVESRPLSKKIRAVGKIDYDETRIASITTKVSGWAEKLYVDFTGQNVQKGDPLIDIYSPELVTTQEEYLQALQSADYFKGAAYAEVAQQLKNLLASTKKRLKLWDITDEQIAELEKTKQVKKTMTIYSPISGIVKHKMINEGERIMPNTHLYEIADLSNVWVQAEIYEYEMPWVEIGQPVTMLLSYYPGQKFKGKISFIYPYLDAKTRTNKVRFEFENPNMELKPDMYANVLIESTTQKSETIVPVSAVILSGERSIVIMDLGEGKFEPRQVTIGIESEDYYTIVDGLQEGEKVVTSAQFLIDSESRLREAQMKMIAPGKEATSVKETVTLIGEGDMKYTCPMPEDMVFSSEQGKCPVCDMNLVEMTPEQKENMQKLIESHEVEHIHIDEKRVETGHEHEAEEKSVIMIGEGAMKYTCPMPDDMVFSAEPGKCPVCNMNLVEMQPEDQKRMVELQKKHPVKKIK